jgi:hypothetical protein
MYVQFTVKEYSVILTNFKLPYSYVMLFDADGSWRARLNFVPLPEINETTNVTISGDFIELGYVFVNGVNSVLPVLPI